MVGTEAGRLGAVWSHMLLCEALAEERPAQFIDESARPGLESLEMDEARMFGIGHVLRVAATSTELGSTGFLEAFASANEMVNALSYPQPSLQAMLVSPSSGTRFLVHVRHDEDARRMMGLARRAGHSQRCLCLRVDSDDPMQAILAGRARDPMASRMVYLGSLDPEAAEAHACLQALSARDDDGEMAWLEAPFSDDSQRDALLAQVEDARLGGHSHTPWWVGELRLRRPFPGIFGHRLHTGCLLLATGLRGSTREWLTAISQRLSDAYRDTRLPDGSRGDLAFCLVGGAGPDRGLDYPAYQRARPGLHS